ncbi:MAG: hypothetical protein HYW45_03230 [Candidatus Daviesbacteria bacterium]|nr:MAG: hypothetical protein HYW45_03230 [Candidatus Daviesbacteria bacterium]
MLPKVIIGVVLVVLGIMIFGFLTRGGFGPPPPGFPLVSQSQQPPCPEPLILQTPVDLNQVTSILYPGQERGGDFKPHGGFRFDNSKNDEIEVRAAMDSELQDASRYIEMGEVQYMFDFVAPCGIRYRFDHLLTLAPKFTAMAEKLPKAKVDDSRTTHIEPVSVKQGEVIATAVGFKNNTNVFVDFGVYDARGKIFSNPRDNAVCWFDLLPPQDSAKVKSLPPADSKSGSTSTLCKP